MANNRSRSRVASVCKQCNKEFEQQPSRVWRDKFCSPKCGYAHRLEKKQAKTRACATCGSEFSPRNWQLSNGGGKFCSQKCNVAGLAALNTASAKSASALSRKKNIASGVTVLAKGADHPNWRGGSEAMLRRRQDSGRMAASLRKYREAHPEKVAEWGQTRRAVNIGRVKRGTVARLLESQRGLCVYCGEPIPPYHLDHKLPVSRGGTNSADNLHLTCPRCNLRKSALTHEEFLVSKRRKSYRTVATTGSKDGIL